jgi:predicted ATP-grasp superfamily ATP-dependent carboligase
MKDPDGFEQKLLRFLQNHQMDVTLSVGDISSEILSKNRDEITKYTKVTVPEYSKFLEVTDKLSLMNFCMREGIPCPVTYGLDRNTSYDLIHSFQFPVIVKPRRGLGAIGVLKIDNPDEVVANLSDFTEKYGPLLIQEYIPQEQGMQYQAQAFLDQDNNMKVCMVIAKPRFFPVNGGTSTANVTVDKPEIVALCKTLLEGIGWTGPADVDLILDPRSQEVKILEVNPRVTAGIKIGFAAGIDYADLHLRLALDKPIPVIPSYQLGVYSRNIFMELLWYAFATKAMKKSTTPSFFKFFGKDVIDQTISLDDPLAGLGFFLNMTRKYLNLGYLKEKLGNGRPKRIASNLKKDEAHY